jgi:hypothetical protein
VACSVLLGKAGWVLVSEDAKQKTNKVPHSDQDTVVSPIALLRDHLSIEHRGAEGKDSENHQADVFATVLDGNHLARSSKRNEFVEAGSDAREDVSSYE